MTSSAWARDRGLVGHTFTLEIAGPWVCCLARGVCVKLGVDRKHYFLESAYYRGGSLLRSLLQQCFPAIRQGADNEEHFRKTSPR